MAVDEDFTVFAVGVFEKEVECGLCIDVEAFFGGTTGGESIPKEGGCQRGTFNCQDARAVVRRAEMRCASLQGNLVALRLACALRSGLRAALRFACLAPGELKLSLGTWKDSPPITQHENITTHLIREDLRKG